MQEITQSRQVAIASLPHLSSAGQALGRRAEGRTRTLIHFKLPYPNQPVYDSGSIFEHVVGGRKWLRLPDPSLLPLV